MKLFHPGRIVSTPGALEAFREAGELPWTYLIRHLLGDFGDLDPEDVQENVKALELNLRILSAYHLRNGTKIWCVTEHDRSVTTFLLPSEY
jgi:hypothetical protein